MNYPVLPDSPDELLLNASRYQGVDVKAAVVQIKARRQIQNKLPEWYRDERLAFPSVLAAEQCSSEITALYKQRLVQSGDRVCDLTGGLGVDTYYLSKKVRHVTYVEKDEACCHAVQSNLQLLGATNVQVIHGDAVELLTHNDGRLSGVNVFYIDPARRGTGNKRLYAISDCEPDLMKIGALLPATYRIIIKLSPMLDITQTLNQIPHVSEVHVVSVRNECKELLAIAGNVPSEADLHGDDLSEKTRETVCQAMADPEIFCVNYTSDEAEQSFRFRLADERAAVVPFAQSTGRYLYEPNASILKAGAYKSVALQYGVAKLHKSSHLYTSDQPVMSFPGRQFEITDVLPFNNRTCKTLHATIPQANISVRNFPLTADELRKRTRIHDGGEVYIFATTLSNDQKALIICRKLS